MTTYVLRFLFVSLFLSLSSVFSLDNEQFIRMLKKEHPRLMLDRSSWRKVKTLIAEEPLCQKIYRRIKAKADRIMTQPISRYSLKGIRLLSVSQRLLVRVYHLSFVYRVEGEEKYLDRLWKELKEVSDFPNWNPRHFLDTAEMTHAFAIAYDWLFDRWSEKQRKIIREAIVSKGLREGILVYTRDKARSGALFHLSKHNWNQVCNGGLTVGALAVGDEEVEIASTIVAKSIRSIKLAMSSYEPDGGWSEGPGYWGYATSYNVLMLASLESALGTDFGLSKMEGFKKAILFPIYCSQGNKFFNFSDSPPRLAGSAAFLWLAKKYDQPIARYFQYEKAIDVYQSGGVGYPMNIVWFSRWDKSSIEAMELDKKFGGVETASFRTSWTDSNGLFLAFKGGKPRVPHGRIDSGSFVLDALNERWIEHLPAENYDVPNYWDMRMPEGRRWTYYRTRGEGHNTLVVNPDSHPEQDVRILSKITEWKPDKDSPHAILDLTEAYKNKRVKSLRRQFEMPERKSVRVTDFIDLTHRGEVWWFAHTKARVDISKNGKEAKMSQSGKELIISLRSPKKAKFIVMEANALLTSPQPKKGKQHSNKAYRKLAIHLSNVKKEIIQVEFLPQY